MKINTGLRVIRLAEGSLQFGMGTDSLLVEGLTPADERFIMVLQHGIAEADITAAAWQCGVPADRALTLTGALGPVLISGASGTPLSGLRADRLAPDGRQWSAAYQADGHAIVARRARAAVQIIGLGRCGAALAQSLAGAGVGILVLADTADVAPADVGAGSYRLADVGMPRAQALRRHLHQLDPAVQAHPVPGPGLTGPDPGPGARPGLALAADLVIYVGADTVPGAVAAALMGAELPHLAVLIREQDALVGPLVVPGEGACLDCIDLHRTDACPSWGRLAAGLSALGTGHPAHGGQPGGEFGGQPSGEEVSLAVAAAGLAGMQALLFLDRINLPSAWSAILQVRSSDGLVSRQQFDPHPRCGCRLQSQLSPSSRSTASP